MHYPVSISIGPYSLHIHFILELTAYTLGYRYYAWLRAKCTDSISNDNRLNLFMGATLGAYLGAHTLGILENPTEQNFWSLMNFMGNKTIIGGFLGGLIGVA